MDATSFRAAWEASGDRLCQYPAVTISASKLPGGAKHFLTAAGLPVEAAPFLTFGQIALGWLGRPSEEQDWSYAIGCDGSGDPIVVDEQGAVWLIDHEAPTRRHLVNSSLPALAECLLAYRALVAEANTIGGEAAWLDGSIPIHLIDAFSRSVSAVDPAAVEAGTFWGGELVRLISEAS